MAGLFDQIRQNIDQAANAQKQALAPTDTGALAKALGTKATGKDLGPSAGPAQTNIAAQVQAQAGQEAVSQQAQAAKAAVTQQELQSQAAAAEGAAQSRALQLQTDDVNLGFQQQLQDLHSKVLQHTDEMDTLQREADWDNLGRAYALSSKKQVADMQIANEIYRAQQDVLNNQSLLESQLGPAFDLLKEHLLRMEDLGAVQNQINIDVSNIDAATAVSLASQQVSFAQSTAMASGLATVASAGVKAAAGVKEQPNGG